MEKREDMRLSIEELNRFCTWLFPKEKFQVYVPPSNILSEEGRQILVEDFPQIRAIASIYFPGEFEYSQDFMVSEDGMIETPRIISGYIIGSYMETGAISELNFHYVNSHFQHPDDVLDTDRGVQEGWEKLKNRLTEYTDWLYESARYPEPDGQRNGRSRTALLLSGAPDYQAGKRNSHQPFQLQ